MADDQEYYESGDEEEGDEHQFGEYQPDNMSADEAIAKLQEIYPQLDKDTIKAHLMSSSKTFRT